MVIDLFAERFGRLGFEYADGDVGWVSLSWFGGCRRFTVDCEIFEGLLLFDFYTDDARIIQESLRLGDPGFWVEFEGVVSRVLRWLR